MATQTIIINKWWEYFTTVKKSKSVKCNICSEISSRERAPAHLYRFHKMTDQDVILRWNNDNHSIWRHFIKKDLFSAECKLCGNLINSAYQKRNLDIHLQFTHSQEIAAIREEITRTWVSPHFTFDNNYDTNCIYCDYYCKIYDGMSVLENHLKEVHNLDEHFA